MDPAPCHRERLCPATPTRSQGKAGRSHIQRDRGWGKSALPIRCHEPFSWTISTETPNAETLRIKRYLEGGHTLKRFRGEHHRMGRRHWPPQGTRGGCAEAADPAEVADTHRPLAASLGPGPTLESLHLQELMDQTST